MWAGSDPMVVLGLARQCFRELASCVEGTGVLRRAVYGVFLGHIAAQMEQCSVEALQHWEQVRGCSGSHGNCVSSKGLFLTTH